MPKWVEELTGELVHETSQDSKTTELQVPLQAQVPWTADWPALSLGFRLVCYTSATLRAMAASLDLRILRPAVLVIGCACEGLCSQVSTS